MNICLVGYGAIAESHAKAMTAIDDVNLRWLVGRRTEPTQAFAARFGFEHLTLELDEALADDCVQAVVITSPNAMHAPQATAALDAGKHVLLEIPIALTLDDAQRVAALARQVDRKLMICHSTRFYPSFAYLRELVNAGKFHMYQFIGNMFIRRRTNITAAGNPRSWTDNILWHHGAHLIDLSMWLADCFDVERVSYHVGPNYKEQATMDMSFTMTLANGAIVTISQSYFTPAFGWQVNAIGHEQTFCWKDFVLYDFEDNEIMPYADGWDLLVQDTEFVNALREDRDPSVTAESIMPTMRAIAQAQAIVDAQTPTTSPYEGDD
jgi:2-hydroxy-4-carboxymuconate semialdehyde hemiacetal dehydrogenase